VKSCDGSATTFGIEPKIAASAHTCALARATSLLRNAKIL
jgi:hypothetical protein